VLLQAVLPHVLAVVGGDDHQRAVEDAPRLEGVQQGPHIAVGQVDRVVVPVLQPVAGVPGAPRRDPRTRGVGVEEVQEDEEALRSPRVEPLQELGVHLRAGLGLVVPPEPLGAGVAEGHAGAEAAVEPRLTQGELVVAEGLEAAGQAALAGGVGQVGDEGRGAVPRVPKRLGQHPVGGVERPQPVGADLLVIAPGEHRPVAGQGPRRHAHGAVEDHAAAGELVHPRSGGAGVAVEAQGLRPHRVEDDQQHVRQGGPRAASRQRHAAGPESCPRTGRGDQQQRQARPPEPGGPAREPGTDPLPAPDPDAQAQEHQRRGGQPVAGKDEQQRRGQERERHRGGEQGSPGRPEEAHQQQRQSQPQEHRGVYRGRHPERLGRDEGDLVQRHALEGEPAGIQEPGEQPCAEQEQEAIEEADGGRGARVRHGVVRGAGDRQLRPWPARVEASRVLKSASSGARAGSAARSVSSRGSRPRWYSSARPSSSSM
jgi:hypothetical protein